MKSSAQLTENLCVRGQKLQIEFHRSSRVILRLQMPLSDFPSVSLILMEFPTRMQTTTLPHDHCTEMELKQMQNTYGEWVHCVYVMEHDDDVGRKSTCMKL